ncbi:putative farnesyltransferase beta subunit ram1 [Phaeomoniella chlamydospora]|uniref:Protein farnesyltransferase subunit beta n=1 Tax=Phaeomoniella chlamydospora TaxID=158046 RepID=A0A0G2F3Q8_PHACM|nr:putative farnesyltransferase beta subunit ram1 [Phaeomoniella chlamydospora]
MRPSRRKVVFNRTSWRYETKPHAPGSTNHPTNCISRSAAKDMEGIPTFDISAEFTQPPEPQDDLITETSKLQAETVAKCLPFLLGPEDPTRNPFDFNEFGVPRLEKIDHVEYLRENLSDFPAPFVVADASRPWMVYWAINGLSLLGQDVSRYRKDVIKTFSPAQSPRGGFGGGHGQLPHLAGSYAALLTIALVGGTEAYDMVDRHAMWQWLGRLKRPDGGFQICEGGEVDTRGAYSAMVLITLLNLPLDLPPDSEARTIGGLQTLTDGLPEWISRCQTYEGGIGGSPGNEAHGAYTFLGIACLCLLGSPEIMLRKHLDLDNLISWLVMQQYAPEGGLAGRKNKLVDGCYSHWLGGCFPLVQAALQGPMTEEQAKSTGPMDIYNREGLVRYTLSCCQQKHGGLRDKPGTRADAYHTNYILSALSQTQHFIYHTPSPTPPSPETSSHRTAATAFQYKALPLRPLLASQSQHPHNNNNNNNNKKDTHLPRIVYDEDDEIQALHPLFVISDAAVKGIREWSLGKEGKW